LCLIMLGYTYNLLINKQIYIINGIVAEAQYYNNPAYDFCNIFSFQQLSFPQKCLVKGAIMH